MKSKKQSLIFLELLITGCLISLLLMVCNPAPAQALESQDGLCTFWYYGGGATHGSIESVKSYKLQRAFVDYRELCHNSLADFNTDPTWKNFHYDSYLQTLHDSGVYTYGCGQGINNWENPGTYIDNEGKVKDRSRGKTCIPLNSNPNDPATWYPYVEISRRVALHYKDKGTLNAIGFKNEFDFKWNVWHVVTYKEYALGAKLFYEAVRSVNPTIDIILGEGITPSIDSLDVFMAEFDRLFALEGKPKPRDFVWFVHWYLRSGSINQGEGTGITPEDAGLYEWGVKMNARIHHYGLKGFGLGESGYSSTAGNKQSAPVLQGFTREESQGILMERTTLILAQFDKFVGVTFWHCADNYDGEPYRYGGVNYRNDGIHPNWSAKPARLIHESFMAMFGQYDVLLTVNSGNYWESNLSGNKSLKWTNKYNFGDITPMPREVGAPSPIPAKYLIVNNSRLFWNDGTPAKIVEANSPENAVRWNDYAWLDWLNSKGVNTIYCVLLGGDDATVHPYINRSNPSQGFNQVTINQWKAFLNHWVVIGNGKNICHLLLSEKENHDALSISDMKTLIDKMVLEFGHLPVIWDREEVPNGWSKATEIYTYLKSKDPYGLRGMHNNTSQNPWSFAYGTDLVQFCSFQESVNSFNSRIPGELNKFTLKKTAGYASEMTGGFVPGDVAKAQTIFQAGGTLNAGAGVFVSNSDQKDTRTGWYTAFESIYVKMAQLAGATPNPCTGTTDCNGVCDGTAYKDNCNICVGGNTGKIPCSSVDTSSVIKFYLYDATTDQKLFQITDGMSFSRKDSIAITAEGVLPPVRMYFNGTQTRYEQKAPYSVFNETNGNFEPKGLSVGTHVLRALSEGHNPDKSRTITFTITSSTQVPGCTDPLATNYNSNATVNDGTCIYPVRGCTDRTASNYNPNATVDDGTCVYFVRGCTDSTAINYNPLATLNEGCLWNKPCPR